VTCASEVNEKRHSHSAIVIACFMLNSSTGRGMRAKDCLAIPLPSFLCLDLESVM
jgi:hypothetical protein